MPAVQQTGSLDQRVRQVGDATSLRDAQNTDRYLAGSDHTLAHVSVRAAIGLGAVLGLALGIIVSLTTDVPFAPEVGLALGALLGWLSHRRLVTEGGPTLTRSDLSSGHAPAH
jgi:hypothetical protein